MSPSPMQLLIVVVIVLVLFGASRLGEVGKGLGDGIRNFKKGLNTDDEDEDGKAPKELTVEGSAEVVGEDKKKEEA